MTGQPIIDQPASDRRVFPAETLARMEALYPAQAGLLHHRLPEHRLLSLDALAALGEEASVWKQIGRDYQVKSRPARKAE